MLFVVNKVYPQTTGNIHNHQVHFKVDPDIHGTENRIETKEMRGQSTPAYNTLGNVVVQQVIATVYSKEKAAPYKYDHNKPTYLLVYNNNVTNRYGNHRAYRLLPLTMFKFMLSDSESAPIVKSTNWARYTT